MKKIKTRYIFVIDSFAGADYFMHQYSFPHLVYAIDLKEMCGFTPQDWNFTWVPTSDFTEVTLDTFKEISKNLKTKTTHFMVPH